MRFAERAREAADQDQSLGQEWIWANVLLGDLASLIGDLNLANESYDQALTRSQDEAEQRWIGNKRHQPHFTIRDGTKIAYYEHGSGSETLVFMSPIGYGLAPWQPVVERLCQEFRVVTIDPRGTGRSDPLLRPYRSKDHGLDIAAVVRQAAEGQVIAIGLSRGGVMMTHAAAQEPALFKKLILVGTTAGPAEAGHPLFDQISEERQLLEIGQREHALRLFATRTFSEPGTEDLRDQRINAAMRLPEETIRSFFDPRPPADSKIIGSLRDLRIPTLIMHGTADKRVPFEDGLRIAEKVDTARLYAFEGRCHVCMLTATEEFCKVLREFVRTGAVNGALARSASSS